MSLLAVAYCVLALPSDAAKHREPRLYRLRREAAKGGSKSSVPPALVTDPDWLVRKCFCNEIAIQNARFSRKFARNVSP